MTARPVKAAEREPLVSLEEVAAFLGVSPRTVIAWRYHHRGPQGYRVGRYVKFRMTEVESWLQGRQEAS